MLTEADLETQKAVGLGACSCSSHVWTPVRKVVEMLRMLIKIIIMMTLTIGGDFFFFSFFFFPFSFSLDQPVSDLFLATKQMQLTVRIHVIGALV